MTFKIVVCIKQVPDTQDIKWTEKNTIAREGMDLVINPFDLGALQMALDVKKYIFDVEIILVSMGPSQAAESLSYGLALGADKAYLLCDRKFAASDTLATAYCLSCFLKTQVPDCRVIICGQQAVDGDTAQTPSALAEKLGIPSVTLAKKLLNINNEYASLLRETPLTSEEIEISLPCVIAVDSQEIAKLPKIGDFIRAQKTEVKILSGCEIGSDECNTGISGSPTFVKKAFRPENTREARILDEMSEEDYAEIILKEIKKL